MLNRSIYFTLFISLFAFSFWLMWSSLSSSPGQINVGGKFWSDFGSHLPLIRSFSLGSNWPPQYPLYPGMPIQYHFLFYAFAGLLEKIGLPIASALNIPSALGFFSMLVLVSLLAKKITKSVMASILSVVFVLFNASLSWFEFLQKYSLSDLWILPQFVSFGPWNGSQIAAIWNLNIYTNQRHLGFSFAVTLLVVYVIYAGKTRLICLTGLFIGILLLTNMAAAAIACAFMGWFFLCKPSVRKPLLISLVGLMPLLIFFLKFITPPPGLHWHPGFLSSDLSLLGLTQYWFKNLGIHSLLIPLGIVLIWKKTKIFILPLVVLFILPNLFQFSPDVFNNHKFFNFFIVIGGIFSAYAIVKLKWLGVLLIPFCIAGGIVDFMPIKNDVQFTMSDKPSNPDINFFINNTPPNAVVLNSTWFYHPASLAGRKIYNGYPYFTWSYGYDQVDREQKATSMYAAPDSETACRLLKSANISYVELSPNKEPMYNPSTIWQSWQAVYVNDTSGLTIYSVASNCSNT